MIRRIMSPPQRRRQRPTPRLLPSRPMTLIRRTMSRAPEAKTKEKAKTPAEPADDNDDDQSDDEPAPKAKAKAKAPLLPGRQLWATLRTSAASRNFPKQYLHHHKRRAAGQSTLQPDGAGPHVQHHWHVVHPGPWYDQWLPRGGHHHQSKARPTAEPFSEAGYAPGRAATSLRTTSRKASSPPAGRTVPS